MINVQAPTSPEQHVSDQITTAMISILNFPKTATNTSRESLLSSRARAGVLRASARAGISRKAHARHTVDRPRQSEAAKRASRGTFVSSRAHAVVLRASARAGISRKGTQPSACWRVANPQRAGRHLTQGTVERPRQSEAAKRASGSPNPPRSSFGPLTASQNPGLQTAGEISVVGLNPQRALVRRRHGARGWRQQADPGDYPR